MVIDFTFNEVRHAFALIKDKNSIRVMDSAKQTVEYINSDVQKPQFDLQKFLEDYQVVEVYKLDIEETEKPLVKKTFIKQVLIGQNDDN